MYATTNRTEKIASILQKRRPLAEKIQNVETNLRSLSSTLRHLEDSRNHLLAKLEDQNACQRLQEIDCTAIQKSIRHELTALSQLKMRFCRDTLNIGVVGRARQGKSRLLQSLTGLTTAEIPDGDRQHCTGVRSTIYHHPNVNTYGEVWFYSEQSFLDEVIRPYYQKLGLGNTPNTIEEFGKNPLPNLPKNIPGYAEPAAMYEHLKKYHTNLEKYQHLLQKPSPRRISRDEIREYVAQDTPEGERIFFNYLAVREVKIFCNFPNTDVGQIALVDMPGLGDTGVGDEDRLMRTLGQDVDAVLFVRMPKSSGDYWAEVDVKLYDTARQALLDLPLDLWSFMVLNQTSSNSKNHNNFPNCQDLAADISNKHINVRECIIANCAEVDETNKLLDRVLEYFALKITDLDKQYATACQERLIKLHQQVQAELKKANDALSEEFNDEEDSMFDDLFEEFFEEVTNSLEELLKELIVKRDSQNDYLKQQIEEVFQLCRQDTGIPTVEDIKKRANREGSYLTAYSKYLHEIRTNLSNKFLSLDDSLKYSIEEIKSLVADVLVEKGHLGGLTAARGSEFIKVIAEEIPDTLSSLKHGFQILSDFQLSYRGLIQHRIRKHLDKLTPNLAVRLPQTPDEQNVLDTFQEIYPEVIYQCGNALQDFLTEPNQAAFAILEEFVDRVLRAENIEKDWRKFLRKVRKQVWAEHFQPLADKNRLLREWFNVVEQATNINDSPAQNFLK
ncbi:hypothetical protein [Anabaena sp. CA = ATCC 33047]|uniref:hypothetical protein n=1 Tax=Anabaena sp. (strain CA / ATCC 33047) TaxID=52271 RepID=UPI00083635E5|nr:hypothetical protein [Anabaena sp. CA = ATCC 33047]